MTINTICKGSVRLECYNYYRALTKGDNKMASKKTQERERLQKVYGHLYKRHFITEGYKCFYCGETAQCLDHSPALSTLEGMPKNYMKKNEIPHTLLPCCFQCNAALGSKNLPTVIDRLLYLESYYDAFFKKQKKKWDSEKIEELGNNLKRFVKHKQEQLDVYLWKIRAIQMRQIKPETFPIFEGCSDVSEL